MLDTLINNLKSKHLLRYVFVWFGELTQLICKKGVYPYLILESFEFRYKEKYFHKILDEKDISSSEHKRALNVHWMFMILLT